MSPSNVFEVKLQVTWILISDWLNYAGVKPYTGFTSLSAKQALPWAGKTRKNKQVLWQKVELLSTFCNNISQPVRT